VWAGEKRVDQLDLHSSVDTALASADMNISAAALNISRRRSVSASSIRLRNQPRIPTLSLTIASSSAPTGSAILRSTEDGSDGRFFQDLYGSSLNTPHPWTLVTSRRCKSCVDWMTVP